MLVTDVTSFGVAGAKFSELVTPGVDGAGSSFEIEPKAVGSLFVAYSGSAQHFIGIEQPGPFLGNPPDPTASYQLAVAWAHTPPNPYVLDGPHIIGCVDEPVTADALRLADGWLLARAMGNAGCQDNVPPEPATELNVSTFDANGVHHFGASLGGTTPVDWLALTPRSDGAWLVWRRQIDDPIQAARLDSTGALAAGPFTLTDGKSQPRWIAATNLGDALALAWIDTIVNGTPLIVVSVFGNSGETLASATHAPSFWPGSVPTILASPSGDSVLVGWAEQLGDDGIPDEVRVARFDCVGG